MRTRIAAGLLAACVAATSATAASLFVDQATGSDAGDGLSWVTARATVGSALATAAGTPEPDVISVAAGRYVEQLVVPADTSLLGGFPPGGGTRDPLAHPTVLDGARAGTVVRFPPGSDRGGLDGFTVMGGFGTTGYGGGILIEDAAPLIHDNIVEWNRAYRGAGIALIYTVARPAARIDGNVVRHNKGSDTRYPCERGSLDAGAGIYVVGPPGADLGVVLSGNRIAENEACLGAAVYFDGQGILEHDIIQDNWSGLWLASGPIRVFNEALTGSPRAAVTVKCGGTYQLESVTIASNRTAIDTDAGAATDLRIESSILWGDAAEVTWDCTGPPPVVVSSLVEGGYAGGTGIIDADPLFVPGPQHSHYLSQVASGQSATSPAVDAGSRSSAAAGLDQRTTATDSALDSGPVDLGFHAEPVPALTILRGSSPQALAVHRVVASLPFVDDPGTLSDPALPLLFYDVRVTETDIAVTKDAATDAVVLSFR